MKARRIWLLVMLQGGAVEAELVVEGGPRSDSVLRCTRMGSGERVTKKIDRNRRPRAPRSDFAMAE